MFLTWWQRLFQKRSSKKTRRFRASTRLMELETLEVRMVPANIFVHSGADGAAATALTNMGGGNWLAPSLRSAVFHHTDFSGLSTIILDGGTTYKITTAFGGQIDIQYSSGVTGLKITSQNGMAILDGNAIADGANGNSPHRIFEVYGGGATTLDNLKLTDGKAPDNSESAGGAILEDFNGNLTLSNDIFTDNSTYGGASGHHGSGGAVFDDGSSTPGVTNLKVTNCTFGTVGHPNTAQGGSIGGNNNGGGAEGGAICARNGANILITGSTFAYNQANGGANTGTISGQGGNAYGGAIEVPTFSSITLKIYNSTFAHNQANGGSAYGGNAVTSEYGGVAYGGAIDNGKSFTGSSSNSIKLVNDTIAFNQVFGGEGGGVANFGAASEFSVENTIIAKNMNTSRAGFPSPDILGNFTSLRNNLIGDGTDQGATSGPGFGGGFSSAHHDLVGTETHSIDPKLGLLAFNGGPTQTLALLAGSPAIDFVDNDSALALTGPFDQRGMGFSRKVGPHIDIGAFEVQLARGRRLVNP